MDVVEKEVLPRDGLARPALGPGGEVHQGDPSLPRHLGDDPSHRPQGAQGADVLVAGALESLPGFLVAPEGAEYLAAQELETGVAVVDRRRPFEGGQGVFPAAGGVGFPALSKRACQRS